MGSTCTLCTPSSTFPVVLKIYFPCSCLQRVVTLKQVFLGGPCSCLWRVFDLVHVCFRSPNCPQISCSCLRRVVDLRKVFFWSPKSLWTHWNSKYERMTAPKSESSRRDMQNRLILVSNGRNFDMFTALQRSASSSRPVLVHISSPVRKNSSLHGSS